MIEVEGPDGTVYEVETDDENVARETVRRHLAKGTQAPVSAGQQAQPAGGQAGRSSNPLDMVIAGARDRVAPFALNAADSGSFGAFDEITGALRGGAVLQRDAQRRASQGGLPGAITEGVGHFARPFQAFAQRVTGTESPEVQAARKTGEEQVRSGLASARENYPVTSLTGAVAGALPLAGVGGGGAPARLGGRVMQGMGIGGATGVVYGYNSGEDGNRLTNAAVGGVIGAGTGAAVPVAFKGAEVLGNRANALAMSIPAVRDAANAVDNFFYQRTPEPGRAPLNMMAIGIPPRQRPPRATPRFQPPTDPISGRAARLADRANMTPEQIDARIAEFQADPRGRTMAEVFGEPGVQSAATMARLPGQTGERARVQMTERNAGQAQRLGRDLSGQTAEPAATVLDRKVKALSEELLTPVLNAPRAPDAQRAAAQAWDLLSKRESIKAALPAARNQIKELVQRGKAPPDALNDPGYLAHYTKMQLQAQAKDPRLVKTSAQQVDNSNLGAGAADLKAFLDEFRPGYAQAMEELQQAIIPRGIARRVETARGVNPNVARQLRGDPKVRAGLEKPYMQSVRNALLAEDDMFQNATRIVPSSGSNTALHQANMADEMALGTAGGNIPRTMGDWAGLALSYMRNSFNETQRNQYGQFLLRVVDDPQSGLTAAERQAITRELAKIQAQRATQTAATRATAGGAAVGGNNALNQ